MSNGIILNIKITRGLFNLPNTKSRAITNPIIPKTILSIANDS